MAHNDPPISDGSEASLIGHEPDRIHYATIVLFGFGLTFAVVIVFFIVWLLLLFFRDRDQRASEDRSPLLAITEGLYPGPMLQEHPNLALEQYKAEMKKKADSYDWVDETAGIARIPVARALDLAAKNPRLFETPPAPPEPTAPAVPVVQPAVEGAVP